MQPWHLQQCFPEKSTISVSFKIITGTIYSLPRCRIFHGPRYARAWLGCKGRSMPRGHRGFPVCSDPRHPCRLRRDNTNSRSNLKQTKSINPKWRRKKWGENVIFRCCQVMTVFKIDDLHVPQSPKQPNKLLFQSSDILKEFKN